MITGASITLGPIFPADFPALLRWQDDFEAASQNHSYRPPVWKNEEEFWFNVGKDPSRVYFAVRKVREQAIIGYVQIWNIEAVHRSAIIGIRIGDEANRGRGYGMEALRLTVKYCWNQLNITRISLCALETNHRAIRVYAANGFEKEGVLRRALFIEGKWTDLILMSLLHPSRVQEEKALLGTANTDVTLTARPFG